MDTACRVEAETHQYMSRLESLSQIPEANDSEVEYILRSLVDDAIVDCTNEDTIEAFFNCDSSPDSAIKDAWRNLASIRPAESINDLTTTELISLARNANTFLNCMNEILRESLRPVAEDEV